MDITAAIIFHREGLIAASSVQSFTLMCDTAAANGLDVERIAVVDRPDATTIATLAPSKKLFDQFIVVDFGDLGSSRNAGTQAANGRNLCFFDGDDLWGDQWLIRAHVMAEETRLSNTIFHPEVIHYFCADDYLVQSSGQAPDPRAKAFLFYQQDSAGSDFDPRALLLNNIWTANTFARREVYEKFAYRPVNRRAGFGVEDWTWNAETLAAGYRHAVVPDTVHCVRVKSAGSLSVQNAITGILPEAFRFTQALEAGPRSKEIR